jgi:hypothetical protein
VLLNKLSQLLASFLEVFRLFCQAWVKRNEPLDFKRLDMQIANVTFIAFVEKSWFGAVEKTELANY